MSLWSDGGRAPSCAESYGKQAVSMQRTVMMEEETLLGEVMGRVIQNDLG